MRFEIPTADYFTDAEKTFEQEREIRAAHTCPECDTNHSDPMAIAPLDCGTCGDPDRAAEIERRHFEADHGPGRAYS